MGVWSNGEMERQALEYSITPVVQYSRIGRLKGCGIGRIK